jgi:EAL domain-containing protein (putative c-di-GMP-specific phosphodiesterase class I)
MNTHSVYTHLRLPLSREKNIIDRASLKRFSEDAESTERLLFNLKDLGIQLSIDDFGT